MLTNSDKIVTLLNEQLPVASEIIEALRASGVAIRLAVHNADTDEVFTDTGDGNTMERAHGWVREQVTGVPYRDPAEVDPVFTEAALRDPILKADHLAKMRGMLAYLIEFYRPALMRHPRLKPAVTYAVEYMVGRQDELVALPTVYDRWDLIAESTIEWLEELPYQRPGKATG